MNPNKASGPDELPARILKNFGVHLAPTLTAIYNQTVLQGVLPDDWKCANVMPLFKKGNRVDPGNYRLVSLTSISCMVLKHILFSHIMNHLDENSILP